MRGSIFTGRLGKPPDMTAHRTDDPDTQLERSGDELEERLDKLGEHIEDAEKKAAARREEAKGLEDVAGDREDTDDEAGGEDPQGAGDER
jgi:hypothetical protein